MVLIGEDVPVASLEIAQRKLKDYKLNNTRLTVVQGMNNSGVDVTSIRAMVMEDFYKNSEEQIKEQQKKIVQLEKALTSYKTFDETGRNIVQELKVLYPSIQTLSLNRAVETRVDSLRSDTVTFAVAKFSPKPDSAEQNKIRQWLKARIKAKELRLIVE